MASKNHHIFFLIKLVIFNFLISSFATANVVPDCVLEEDGNYYCYVRGDVDCFSMSTDESIAKRLFEILYPKCVRGDLVQDPFYPANYQPEPEPTAPIPVTPIIASVTPDCVFEDGNYYCYVRGDVDCFSVSTDESIAKRLFEILYPKCVRGDLVQDPFYPANYQPEPEPTAPIPVTPIIASVTPDCVLEEDGNYYCYVRGDVNCFSMSTDESIAKRLFEILYPKCVRGDLVQDPFYPANYQPEPEPTAPIPVTPIIASVTPDCVLEEDGNYYCYVRGDVNCFSMSTDESIAKRLFEILYPKCVRGDLVQDPFYPENYQPEPVVDDSENDEINFIADNGPSEYALVSKNQVAKLMTSGIVEQKNNIILFKPKKCFSNPSHPIANKNYFLIKQASLHTSIQNWSEFCGFNNVSGHRFLGFKLNSYGISLGQEIKKPDYRFINKNSNIFFTNNIDNDFQIEAIKLSKPKMRFKIVINESLPNARSSLFSYYLGVNNAQPGPLSESDKSRLKNKILPIFKTYLTEVEDEFLNTITVEESNDSITFINIGTSSITSSYNLLQKPEVRKYMEPGVINMYFGMPVSKTIAVSLNNGARAGFFKPRFELLDLELLRHEISHNMGANHPRCIDSVNAVDFPCASSRQATYKIRRADKLDLYEATDDLSIMDDRAIPNWQLHKQAYADTIYKNLPVKLNKRIIDEQDAFDEYESKYAQNISYWIDYARALEWYYDLTN